MKTLIVGPGAIGCLLYFKLLKKCNDIFLLDKNEDRKKVILENGITVENIFGKKENVKANIITNVESSQRFDLIIITTKAYDTESAIKSVRSIIDPTCYILTLQNGLNNIETIREVVGKDGKIFAGITSLGAINISHGNIKHTGEGETIIASCNKKDKDDAKKIANFFNMCQIQTKLGNDAQSLVWSKLLINIGINALASILNVQNGVLIKNPYAKKIMFGAIYEAEKIVKKKNIKLIYSSPYKKVEDVCKKTSQNINSTLQDLQRGKKTEIDYLQGAVVKEGKKLKIKTPINEMLLYLIHSLERNKNA